MKFKILNYSKQTDSIKQLAVFNISKKNKAPFSIAIGNVELVHECFPEHSPMGTARMKQDKETDEGGKKRGASFFSKAGTKNLDGPSVR